MQFTKAFAIAAFFAASAFAAPGAEPTRPDKPGKPNKPEPKPPVNQSNACGNNASPYCCNTDNKGSYASCYAFGKLLFKPSYASSQILVQTTSKPFPGLDSYRGYLPCLHADP